MLTSLLRTQNFYLVYLLGVKKNKYISIKKGEKNRYDVFCCCSSVIVCLFSSTAFEIINFLQLLYPKHFSCSCYKKELATAFSSLTSSYSFSYLTLGKYVVFGHCCGLMKAFCKLLSIS